MMSAKFLDSSDPPCPHLELICSIKFTQPPCLHPLFHDPLPPQMRTSFLEAPLARRLYSPPPPSMMISPTWCLSVGRFNAAILVQQSLPRLTPTVVRRCLQIVTFTLMTWHNLIMGELPHLKNVHWVSDCQSLLGRVTINHVFTA